MYMYRFLLLLVVFLSIADNGQSSRVDAQEPESTSAPTKTKPWFVDDEQLFNDFTRKLTAFAKEGKCLANDQLIAKLGSGTKPKISFTKPSDKVLSPDEVYKAALPSVFIIGSVHKCKEKGKEAELCEGMYATAWVAAEDGILVTNWHVFEDLCEGEVFGAVDYKGNVYPVIDFLGGDKAAEVAIVRIDAKGLKPLPVDENYAEIGSWVSVLCHPGYFSYIFTQGNVTRYSTNRNDERGREHWMGITAEYGVGSSGSPVLNKYGAVVGMAAVTITLDGSPGVPKPNRLRLPRVQPPASASPENADAKMPPKADEKPGAGSSVQIILKMAVPGPIIHKTFAKP
jgi:serine protease Do